MTSISETTDANERLSINAQSLEELRRPVHPVMPNQLWTETLPNLWQGGTLDRWAGQDWYDQAPAIGNKITPEHFDSVITLYASAEPADWFVKEVRLGFYDSAMGDFNPETELEDIVKMAHKDWKSGKKVLIRCQAGLNRSGIVMALVLIREGYSPEEAITVMREKRSRAVLCNKHFVDYLLGLNEDPVALEMWRN
jgi:hypothetical protein